MRQDVMHERIIVRDFVDKLVDSLAILANGDFIDSTGRIVGRAELGEYILRIVGHPARASTAKPVV